MGLTAFQIYNASGGTHPFDKCLLSSSVQGRMLMERCKGEQEKYTLLPYGDWIKGREANSNKQNKTKSRSISYWIPSQFLVLISGPIALSNTIDHYLPLDIISFLGMQVSVLFCFSSYWLIDRLFILTVFCWCPQSLVFGVLLNFTHSPVDIIHYHILKHHWCAENSLSIYFRSLLNFKVIYQTNYLIFSLRYQTGISNLTHLNFNSWFFFSASKSAFLFHLTNLSNSNATLYLLPSKTLGSSYSYISYVMCEKLLLAILSN